MRILVPLAASMLAFVSTIPASASLLPNSDFEIENDDPVGVPDAWFRGGPIAWVQDDDSDGVGTSSVEIQGNAGDWRSQAIFVTPGDELTWSLDYKFLSGTTGEFSADLRFFAGLNPLDGGTSGLFRGEQRITFSSTPTGDWETLGPNTFEVPAGALTADVRISTGLFDSGITGPGVRFDNVQVEVPEPSAFAIIASFGLAVRARRRR